MEDTIVAISTASGVGAISIIRLSGPNALEVASSIFKGKDLKRRKIHRLFTIFFFCFISIVQVFCNFYYIHNFCPLYIF